jgi:asparagine synthase (glutamine-hydrolysing)
VAALAAERAMDIHFVWEEYGGTTMADAYWRTLDAQDAPIPSGSVIAQNIVFSAAHAAGFKVLLGGQGGDEALMGYHKYRLLQLRHLFRERRYLAVLRAGIGLVPAVMGLRRSLSGLWWHRKRYLNVGGARHRLLLPEAAPLSLIASPSAPLWERQMLDVVKTSLPSLLRYEDRNSMGSSVESRLPFLDYRIIELGLALPESQKLRSGWGKWILRTAMAGELPDAIRLNPAKRGFDANESAWIRSGLGKAMRERLHDAGGRIGRFLPPGASIERWYSDDALRAPGNVFAEAGALLWLAGRA